MHPNTSSRTLLLLLVAVATIISISAIVRCSAQCPFMHGMSAQPTDGRDPREDPLVVLTDSGYVRGKYVVPVGMATGPNHALVKAFLGIPYAEPPVRGLRFWPPMPHSGWGNEIRNCTEYGAACPQAKSNLGPESLNEDCLTLNVWVPSPRKNSTQSNLLPVFVFIHGGAFVLGSSKPGAGGFDGEFLAQATQSIVVTMNYRLGPLGFMAHKRLVNRNLGIDDQREALRWVQRNIHNFGGDPNQVTLGGESAGGVSICFHVASKESQELFNRALIQSGPCTTDFPTAEKVQNTLGDLVISKLGCNYSTSAEVFECMQRVNVSDILHAVAPRRSVFFGKGPLYMPFIRGSDFPEHPVQVFKDPQRIRPDMSFIIGATQDEGTLFSLLGFPILMTDSIAEHYVSQMFTLYQLDKLAEDKKHQHDLAEDKRKKAMQLLEEYKNIESESPYTTNLIAKILGDGFSCGSYETARILANTLSKSSSSSSSSSSKAATPAPARVYTYTFTHVPESASRFSQLGAFHGSDLIPLFHQTLSGTKQLPPKDHRMSVVMATYLAEFFAKGYFLSPLPLVLDDKNNNPADDTVPYWLPFLPPAMPSDSSSSENDDATATATATATAAAAAERYMNWSINPTMVSNVKKAECGHFKHMYPEGVYPLPGEMEEPFIVELFNIHAFSLLLSMLPYASYLKACALGFGVLFLVWLIRKCFFFRNYNKKQTQQQPSAAKPKTE